MQRLLETWWNKSYYAKDDNTAASLGLDQISTFNLITILIYTDPTNDVDGGADNKLDLLFQLP